MTKAIAVRMQDSDGKVYRWSVTREPRAYNCNGSKSRFVSGWNYTDHEGYTRFSEGNWMDLVAAFRATAENYGFKTNIS